jgi:signal transduction histidine kinase
VYAEARLDDKPRDAWVAVFQDVTHLKEAEIGRLHFIQGAAHELRNPLGVAMSAMQMLQRNLNPTTVDQEIFAIAERGLNRMQELIDDILDLERLESGVGLHFEPIHIPTMIERIAQDMRPVLARKKQALVLDTAATLPLFNGDERWLYRALVNLVSNAHKYTPEGSKVTIRAEAKNGELNLQVEDNGPGIPRDVLPRLFDRFYRARRTEQKVTGTGLGLSIVKSVAEKHQGRAFVRSELPMFSTLWTNRGSVFGMIMPYRAPAEPER